MCEETSRKAQTLELSPPQRLNGLHDVRIPTAVSRRSPLLSVRL